MQHWLLPADAPTSHMVSLSQSPPLFAISTGKLKANDYVSIFLMDYPQRTRLKLMGHMKVLDSRLHSRLLAEIE